MLDKLIDFAVHRRALTLTAAFVFAIFGILTFGKLKIEAFPDVTNVQVMVITPLSRARRPRRSRSRSPSRSSAR